MVTPSIAPIYQTASLKPNSGKRNLKTLGVKNVEFVYTKLINFGITV